MIVQLVIWLLAVAVVSMLIPQKRRKKIWSIFIMLALAAISVLLLDTQDGEFVYQWLSSQKLSASFNISSSDDLKKLFMPLFAILAAVIYMNTIRQQELHSLRINTLLLLDFICLILAISSYDFIQLMFAVSMISILVFYIPDLDEPKKRLFTINFLADMAIFIALAIVYSCTESIIFTDLPKYIHHGKHKDLVAILLLFAMGVKFGLVLFNNQYLSLRDVVFNRTMNVMLMTFPFVGIVLMTKLGLLLNAPSIPKWFCSVWGWVSLGSAFLISLINNDLRIKIIALALAVSSFAFVHIFANTNRFYDIVPPLALIMLQTFVWGIVVIDTILPQYNKVIDKDSGRLSGWSLAGCLIPFVGILATLASLSKFDNAIVFAIGYIFCLAAMFKNVCMTQNKGQSLSLPVFYWLAILGVSVPMLQLSNVWNELFVYCYGLVFVASVIFCPTKFLTNLGKAEIWNMNLVTNTFDILLVNPLRTVARFVWLVFDVVVIERRIIASISNVTKAMIETLRSTQKNTICCYILSTVGGIVILIIYWGVCVYE